MTQYRGEIVRYIIIGYGVILALIWFDDVAHLPLMIFGAESIKGWHEALVDSVIVVGVGIPVIVSVRRLVKRLRYLEDFVRVCAWCRKVHYNDRWVSTEDYFNQAMKIQSSHSICPACAAEQGN